MSSPTSTVSPNIISPPIYRSTSGTSPSLSNDQYEFLSAAYKSHEPLLFQHRNGVMSKLIFVPVCTSEQSYRNKGKEVIENVVQSMSGNKKRETYGTELIAARPIIKHLSKAFPRSFESVAKDLVPNDIQLNPYETVALIEYCDITRDTAYNKLNKFFISQRHINLLSPKKSLDDLASGAPKKELLTTELECNTKAEKKHKQQNVL